MPCLYPKSAWATASAGTPGKHSLSFQPLKLNQEPDYRIPCGKCLGCTKTRRRDWGLRMFHESQLHEQSSFITLTYDDEHLPDKINRHDPQKFIKRLRHHLTSKLRYFLTGEYGEKTNRPHYHAVIFGHDFLGGATTINDSMYTNGQIANLWGKGNITISPFTLGTALYTAGYVTKKLDNSDTFSIMSRYPPIGKPWVRKNHDNLRRLESVQVDGQQFPIPKVYLKWLEDAEEFNHIKATQKEKVITYTDRQLDALELNLASANQARIQKETN